MVYLDTAKEFQSHHTAPREALLSRVLSPTPVFTLHGRGCEERQDIEQFIADKFQADYNADIHEFMPMLLSMRCLNSFSGAIGMRRAASSPLFLEQYLNNSIEESIANASDEKVGRRDIIEIGNLVAGRKGPSQFVFLIATSLLHLAGYKWITFTATQALANNLNKLGFPMVKLADADVDCLTKEEAKEWGSYYDTRPQVFAGSLDAAVAIVRKRPLFRKVFALYRREIKRLAQELSGNK
jgi:hypothetical protein